MSAAASEFSLPLAGGAVGELTVQDVISSGQAEAIHRAVAAMLPLVPQLGSAPRGWALTVRISNAAEAQDLNRTYRQKDYTPNVLSFPADPMPETDDAPDDEPQELGDIVLCWPVVQTEAAAQGKAVAAHVMHLTIHGVLHLLGHTHETDPDATRMEALETDILASLNLPNPYTPQPA